MRRRSAARLRCFQGIERRLQHIADMHHAPPVSLTIVDDYGHHPTEITATLEALRQAYPQRRVVLAFQPHRYSRTRDLIDDFGRALSGADALFVTEVYAAGEAPIAGADGRAICRAVRSRGQVEPVFVDRVEELAAALRDLLRANDLLVTMGAGNMNVVSHALPAQLARLRAGAEHAAEVLVMAVAAEFMPRVRRAESMSRHTSWHVGGPAEVFFNPRDRADLAAFLRALPADVPSIGSGSAAICWCATAACAAW